MKKNAIIHLSMAAIVIAFSSFMVRENEEMVNVAKNHVHFQQEECFTKFLSTLKSMEALVYVPEKSISDARKYELNTYSSSKSAEVNERLIKDSDSYVMVSPEKSEESECSKSVLLNFKELNMTVFVKKENVRSLERQSEMSWEGESITSELINMDNKNTEGLQIKGDVGSWADYSPVGFKYY